MTRINFDDETYIDPEYVAHHKMRQLRIDPHDSDHSGIVVAANGRSAWVDDEIAELVYLMWRHDVTTDDSCQDIFGDAPFGEEPWVLLGFPDVEHLRHFIHVTVPVNDTRPGGVADRAAGGPLDPENPYVWRYQIGVYRSVTRALLPATVVFPASDVPVLVDHLRRNL